MPVTSRKGWITTVNSLVTTRETVDSTERWQPGAVRVSTPNCPSEITQHRKELKSIKHKYRKAREWDRPALTEL